MLAEDQFDEDNILNTILDWAGVESPTHHVDGVNAMMDLAQGSLEELGARIERLPGLDGFGDVVIGRLADGGGKTGPGILVLSHLDTVHELGTLENELPIRREGDKVFGPGVLDMKGGACLGLEASSALQRSGTQTRLPVSYMFTSDEEVGSPSTRARIETEAKKHKFILVPEPLRPWGDLVTGRHAIQRFWVRTYGQPSHAGLTKAQGRSAIARMVELIPRIEAMTDYERGITYSVGTVHGGTFVNVVAIQCTAEVLCVAPSEELLEELRTSMLALAGEEDGVRIEVELGFDRPLGPEHDGNLALFEKARVLGKQIGLEFGHCQSGGGSDGNFTGALGLATLDGLGVGGAGAHTFDEHLLVSSLVPRTRLLAGLLETLE